MFSMESSIVKNFESLCRLCLVSGVELTDIYEDSRATTRYGDLTTTVQKIGIITGLEVTEDDGMPHMICKTCVLKITRAYEFRGQAKRSDEIIRRFLQSKRYKEQQEQKEKEKTNGYGTNCENISSASAANGDMIEDYAETLSTSIEIKPEVVECGEVISTDDNFGDENGEQAMIMPVDPMLEEGEEDGSEREIDYEETGNGAEDSLNQFEPIWMGNGQYDEAEDDDEEDGLVLDEQNTQIPNDSGNVSNGVQQQVSNGDHWICQYCNSKFPSEERFNRHALIHTPEPPFPCDYCEETFELRTDLKSHWRVHSDGNPHICQMCGKSFPERMSYLKHCDLHDQVKPFRCPVCQKSFCYGSDLRKHAITHTGVRPYVCSICGNSFTRSTSLNKHLRMHNGNRPFACQQCPKIFGSRGDLKRHQIIHSGIKPWICTICSVPFNRKDKLVRHERLHSGEPRPFQCFECPTSFSRKEDLTKHIQFHHYKPPDKVEKELAENATIKSSTLDQISCDLEEGNKRYKMLIREAFHVESGDSSNPNESANGMKPGDRLALNKDFGGKLTNVNYKCDICHKTFSQKANLDSHKRIHTSARPFACNQCDKSFYRRRELMRHESVHTGYRPFSCGVCGKCFSRTDKLNRHVQTHEYKTAYRNYTCDSCNLNFRTDQELQSHRSFCCPESANVFPVTLAPAEDESSLGENEIPAHGISPNLHLQSLSQDTLNKLENNPEILLLPIT